MNEALQSMGGFTAGSASALINIMILIKWDLVYSRVLNDDIIEEGEGFGLHPHNNMEIITVLLEGELEHKDSMGTVMIMHPVKCR